MVLCFKGGAPPPSTSTGRPPPWAKVHDVVRFNPRRMLVPVFDVRRPSCGSCLSFRRLLRAPVSRLPPFKRRPYRSRRCSALFSRSGFLSEPQPLAQRRRKRGVKVVAGDDAAEVEPFNPPDIISGSAITQVLNGTPFLFFGPALERWVDFR